MGLFFKKKKINIGSCCTTPIKRKIYKIQIKTYLFRSDSERFIYFFYLYSNNKIMQTKKTLNFFFLIIAFILGSTLFKHFDFINLKFENPVLDIIYLIVFLASVYLIIKDYKKPSNS